MSQDWINDLVKRRASRQQDEDRQAEWNIIAKSHAPEMLRKLCKRVSEDVYRFSRETGVFIEVNLQPEQLAVTNNNFPTFWMHFQLRVGNAGVIEVHQTSKKSSSAPQEEQEISVIVIARGQDQLFYRIDGKDFPSESEVAKALLGPLLSVL